ncbi:MAG: sortase [Actinomycetota bacterium]|nr:sortase [Actinomycetota bacterium]
MTAQTGQLPALPAQSETTTTRSRLGPIRRGVRELGLGLITLGVIILAFVAYQLLGTNLTEEHNQSRLRANFLAAPAGPVSAGVPAVGSGPSAPSGGAIDHMVIPKLGVDRYVVEGIAEDNLVNGPGHYPQTALPGQNGNAAIAGHRTTYGAPFFRLDELAPGDDIDFTARGGQQFRYQVTGSSVVRPDDVGVLSPTPDARLTLTTCNPRFSATSRLIVVAKLVGLPVAATTSTANVAPQAPSTLTAGNHRAYPPALFYGGLVIVAWVVTRLLINRTRRAKRAGAFVGGIAVCCVPLWFCFENVVRLLPQSI